MASWSGVYRVCSCANIFLVLVQRSLDDTNESTVIMLGSNSRDPPQHLSMNSFNMCFQVCPTCSNIFALQVWAIETKERQSVFHHLPSFEQDGQLRVLVNEILFIKVFVRLIWRCREYSIWLVRLESQFVSKPDRKHDRLYVGAELTLQNVQSNFLYNARSRSAQM
jgi:hypothetical protein